MSYRSEFGIQFKDADTIQAITEAVDKAIKKDKYSDLTKCSIIRHPDEKINRPDGSIIYIWHWLNEFDDDFSPLEKILRSGKYDIAISRVGESSDDAEETWYGDVTFDCDLYLDRTLWYPPCWDNFKFDTLPSSKTEAKYFANDWQTWQATQSLSYEELNRFSKYFQLIGDFYGLTDEFKENGII